MHEAFAAQVLSVLKMLGSDAFARERLGRDKAVGEVDSGQAQRPRRLDRARPPVRRDRRAHGHDDGQRAARDRQAAALLGICAAGGLGAAAVMEAV